MAQEAAYFALQRPGQGNVAIDKAKKTAYITDLGKSGDGDKVLIDGAPLIDSLVNQHIETLVFTCSHPHSDHSGGIRALFENPDVFFTDADRKIPRFKSIVVIESGVTDSLYSILQGKLGPQSAITLSHLDATNRNAFAQLSRPGDDVYIENIPYAPSEKAGIHGRSIVTHFVLGQKYSNVDFDDASSEVILRTVNALTAVGTTSIDSFVVPHHGSSYHDIEPILRLDPKAAIITVNPRNQYSHPSPSIVLSLMDKLGPQNVFFTGSVDHVVLGPEGVKRGSYRADQAESFELFLRPGYERAKARNDSVTVAEYEQLESRMVGERAKTSEPTKDELEVAVEAAEGANEELMSVADRLALGTSVSVENRRQFERNIQKQAQRLQLLRQEIVAYERSSNTTLGEDRSRVERLLMQLQPSLPSTNPAVPNQDSNDILASALSQAVDFGIEQLLSSVPEPPIATRSVVDARYVAPSDSFRTEEPEVSLGTHGLARVPPQKTTSYEQMESSPSLEDRPGGIAIGNAAQLDSEVSLEGYVLTFDSREETLALDGPDHTKILFEHKIEPTTLKALYRFAASNRSAAVSMGDAGSDDSKTVRLDPSFVDTQVGRDLISADLVGPDLEIYEFLYHGDKTFEDKINAAMKDVEPCIGLANGADTWFDKPTSIHIAGNQFSLTGGIRLEFLIAATTPDQSSCKGLRCKDAPASKAFPSGYKSCHLTGLEAFVDENYPSIAERFPSVENVSEYARIIGFLRWARQPGHLAGVNLASLAGVPASGREYRTPDILTDR